jgi:lipopolysaccharide/colanic/teichoic acid biosynthesis glycosyltransferase
VAPGGNRSPVYLATKRLLDVVGALLLLLLLGPIMLGVLLILLATTRGRPLFGQRRAGYCGRTFRVLKFRTMVLDAAQRQHEVANEKDGPIFKNRRDPRITRFGRLLRKTSLDETPQLLHVLLGQMSLVGPRPMDCREVAQLEPWQRQRLAVKPGLTCLWQVSGRSNIGFRDWMRLDLWYVRNQGLWTDLKLILRTPASVLSGRGAY